MEAECNFVLKAACLFIGDILFVGDNLLGLVVDFFVNGRSGYA